MPRHASFEACMAQKPPVSDLSPSIPASFSVSLFLSYRLAYPLAAWIATESSGNVRSESGFQLAFALTQVYSGKRLSLPLIASSSLKKRSPS